MGKILWALLCLGILTIGLSAFLVYLLSKRRYPASAADAIIVLGAKILEDGCPSNTLKYRLDAAANAFSQGRARAIIVTGGQGPDEPEDEAGAMKRYLAQKGLPENLIFEESESKNTIENLRNARAIMEDKGFSTALIATTDTHMTRARFIAGRLSIQTGAIPARPGRSLLTRFAACVREVLSWCLLVVRIARGEL